MDSYDLHSKEDINESGDQTPRIYDVDFKPIPTNLSGAFLVSSPLSNTIKLSNRCQSPDTFDEKLTDFMLENDRLKEEVKALEEKLTEARKIKEILKDRDVVMETLESNLTMQKKTNNELRARMEELLTENKVLKRNDTRQRKHTHTRCTDGDIVEKMNISFENLKSKLSEIITRKNLN